MAPAPIPSGGARATVVMQHSALSKPCVCTFGVSLLNWTGSELEAANSVKEKWDARITPALATEARTLHVDLYIGNYPDPSGSVRSNTPAVQGTTTGEMLPANCALLVNKFTGGFGRKNRGRFFVPFIATESAVDEAGIVATSDLGFLQTRFTNLLTDLDTEDEDGNGVTPMALFPRTGTGTPASVLVSSLQVSNKVGTQRTRIR